MDARDEVKARLRQYVADNILLDGSDSLADDASFLQHNVLDSTGVLELVMFLEETYGIDVKDAEMLPENLDSFAAIAAFVERKTAGQSA